VRIELSVSGPAFRLSNGTFRFRIEVGSRRLNFLCPGRTFVFRTEVSGSGLKFSLPDRTFGFRDEFYLCGPALRFSDGSFPLRIEVFISGFDFPFSAGSIRLRIELFIRGLNHSLAGRTFYFPAELFVSGVKFWFSGETPNYAFTDRRYSSFVLASPPNERQDRCNLRDRCLDDELASKHHFAVQIKDGRRWLADRETRNGTWIDGRAYLDKFLEHGDRIKCGSTTFLHLVDDDPPAACPSL
jgi:hypothetical protein